MERNKEDFLRVGVITSTHGLKGEVKVFPTTDDVNRFKTLDKCYISYGRELLEVHGNGCKFFKNQVILKFREYNDINEVEKFRQCDILVSREDAVGLLEDEFFICDIIGATVIDQNGKTKGHIAEYLETAANGVFVVRDDDGNEIMIPVVKEWVTDIDMEQKRVTVHTLEIMED